MTTSSSSPVRVRFAPSPTGYLHVGGARTILFNWLYARHTGGKLILRIEDTDQKRSTPEAERMQIQDIHWLGLMYEEGPDVGGPHAPYRQSERQDIYKKYANQLMANGQAYHCFCSDAILDQKRQAALKLGTVPQYDGTCRKLSKEEVSQRLAAGEKALVRFKAPIKVYTVHDLVRGDVTFHENQVGDFVVLRSDGMPVYNFCCIIDDHLMDITHVIRAEEHLSNTVRQLMLFEAFGWAPPQFAHCSLILGADRSKLSKRHGATSVHQYAEQGFLREALLNFMVLLGWSSPEGNEIMTIDEIIKQFSLDRFNKAPSVFDPQKLKWMNGQYIRAMPLDEIFARALPFIEKSGLPLQDKSKDWMKAAFDTIRGHLEVLTDVTKFLGLYFEESFLLEEDALAFSKDQAFLPVAQALRQELEAHVAKNGDALTAEDFSEIQNRVKTASGAKGKGLFMSMRVALTAQCHGPELKLVLPLLGAKAALSRVQRMLEGKVAVKPKVTEAELTDELEAEAEHALE